jgi:hypothetical protein
MPTTIVDVGLTLQSAQEMMMKVFWPLQNLYKEGKFFNGSSNCDVFVLQTLVPLSISMYMPDLSLCIPTIMLMESIITPPGLFILSVSMAIIRMLPWKHWKKPSRRIIISNTYFMGLVVLTKP